MTNPPLWTKEQLTADTEQAVAVFRKERLDEPLERYSDFFETFAGVFEKLLSQLPALTTDADKLIRVITDADAKTAFCYLAAPPISEDDLKTLAETTLSAGVLKKDKSRAKRIQDTVLHIIDPHRFPWVGADRVPSEHELETAIVSSAALVAAKKVETERRMGAKEKQEEKVKQQLRDIDFVEIPSREIQLLADAPNPGEF